MKYRTSKKTGDRISLLGLGTLRFPTDPQGNLDYEKTIQIIRRAIDKGVNYIDLGVNYCGGEAEIVTGMALKDGYREKVIVTDKVLVRLLTCKEDVENTFNMQLEKTGVGYFDYYFVHNVNRTSWPTAQEYGILEFLEEKKKEGLIKHIGFSFHDDVEFFKEIIDAYPWDMCQIQLNYMDTEFQAGLEGLRYAEEKEIPVAIMEPLKGGQLARRPPDSVQEIWDQSGTGWTNAEWAYKWVGDFPAVVTILSSFTDSEYLDEAVRIFDEIEPCSLTDEQKATIQRAADEFRSKIKYPCTECRYCMPCPVGINIPHLIRLNNEIVMYDDYLKVKWEYGLWFGSNKNQFDCIGCGECEKSCPQKINIVDIMRLSRDIPQLT